MARCVFLLRQEIQNFRENRVAENQAKGLETYGPDCTPNPQSVRNGPGGKSRVPEEKLEALPNPKHFPSSWRVSAKPTGSHSDAEEQRELSWFSGLWQPVATLLLSPGTPLPPRSAGSTQGPVAAPEVAVLGPCCICQGGTT